MPSICTFIQLLCEYNTIFKKKLNFGGYFY